MGSKVGKLLGPIASIAAVATGNPELVPLIQGGSTLANGGSIGDALKSGGLAFAGQQVGGLLGNQFPETLGSTFGTGGNSLTDALGYTSTGGGFTNPGTIGGDIKGLSGGSSSFDKIVSNPITSTSPGAASGGGFSSYALPAAGLANSLYANSTAQDQLKKATGTANAALQPYVNNGTAANNKLSTLLGTSGDGSTSAADILAASPGYAFTRDQGIQGLDRSAASRGGLFSGAAAKGIEDYTTGLANNTAQQYIGNLANASSTGLNAAGAQGNNTTALGTAGASGTIGTSNSLNQLLASLSSNNSGLTLSQLLKLTGA